MQLSARQYIFCKQPPKVSSEVNRLRFFDYTLVYGPDLDVTFTQQDAVGVLLIGYMLDPHHPEASNAELADEIVERLARGAKLAQIVNAYGGRWILVVRTGGEITVLHDACGLRQIFYHISDGAIAFASQAKLLGTLFSFKEDAEALAYIAEAQQADKEYTWPLSLCAYREIQRLLPNHLLQSGGAVRFWPDGEQASAPGKDVSAVCAGILKGMMNAAHNRHRLALTLTAGWDTRLLLAGCADRLGEIDAVTLLYAHCSETAEDIVIPQRLCQVLSIKHDIIPCRSDMTPGFRAFFHQNTEYGHPCWGTFYEAVRDKGFADALWVKGSCCEVARNPFGVVKNKYITPKLLCALFDIPAVSLAEGCVAQWLAAARPVCDACGISLLDLFYWEHRMGSWQAMCQNEADMVQDTFVPFNARELLRLLLQADPLERVSPDYRLFRSMIEKLCPEALDCPINPGRYAGWKRKLLAYIKSKVPMIYIITIRMKKALNNRRRP